MLQIKYHGLQVQLTTVLFCAIHWIVIYPVDSVIHLLNNWPQINHYPADKY